MTKANTSVNEAVNVVTNYVNNMCHGDDVAVAFANTHPTLLMNCLREMQKAIQARMWKDDDGNYRKDDDGNYLGDGRIGQDVMKFAAEAYIPFI